MTGVVSWLAQLPPEFWSGLGSWLTTGNAPGWLTGIIASVAAFFAFRSSRASRKSADLAQRQLERLQVEDERDLADGFTTWPTLIREVWTYGNIPADRDPRSSLEPYRKIFQNFYAATIEVENAGDAVIYQAYFYAEGDKSDEPEYLVGLLERVPPKGRGRPIWGTHFPARSFTFAESSFALGAIFIDAHQRHWDRRPTGELRRLEGATFTNRRDQMMLLSAEILDETDWHGKPEFKISAHDMTGSSRTD